MSEALRGAIEVLVIGWGGCFLVMLILFIVVKILLKAFRPSK